LYSETLKAGKAFDIYFDTIMRGKGVSMVTRIHSFSILFVGNLFGNEMKSLKIFVFCVVRLSVVTQRDYNMKNNINGMFLTYGNQVSLD
jgi:hypothetical protein